MVEIDIDFCLGIRLYGSPRKQNVDFFLAANTVKTISAHWNKDTKMVSREFRADFWTLAKMVNYSLRFVILGDMLASKNHCEFIRCVCVLFSRGSLFSVQIRCKYLVFWHLIFLEPYWFGGRHWSMSLWWMQPNGVTLLNTNQVPQYTRYSIASTL